MSVKGLLIDYKWCTGCHSCELACQQEHEFAADVCGIYVKEHGPFHIGGDKWELEYVPVPTDHCDACANRVATGKEPTCVQHCQAMCMKYGDFSELAKEVDSEKQVIYSLDK